MTWDFAMVIDAGDLAPRAHDSAADPADVAAVSSIVSANAADQSLAFPHAGGRHEQTEAGEVFWARDNPTKMNTG